MHHGANSSSYICKIREMVKTPLLIFRRGFIFEKMYIEINNKSVYGSYLFNSAR